MSRDGLVNIAVTLLPGIFDMIRARYTSKHPIAPLPTDAEVVAALEAAIESSVAKDDRWLASHPKKA